MTTCPTQMPTETIFVSNIKLVDTQNKAASPKKETQENAEVPKTPVQPMTSSETPYNPLRTYDNPALC